MIRDRRSRASPGLIAGENTLGNQAENDTNENITGRVSNTTRQNNKAEIHQMKLRGWNIRLHGAQTFN